LSYAPAKLVRRGVSYRPQPQYRIGLSALPDCLIVARGTERQGIRAADH